MKRFLQVAWIFLLPLVVGGAGFDHSHSALAPVLKAVVTPEGLVDYAALKASPTKLDTYLDQLAAVPEKEFMAFSEQEKIAFLINLYNASMLRLVAGRYPISEVKEIGNWLRGPFDQKSVRLMGRTLTLADIEHGTLRRNHFEEPRFHFALTSAALGSPPLRTEPYQAEKLTAQLDDQARRFLSNRKTHFFEPATRTLTVSRMLKWYEKDFIRKNEKLTAFLLPYLPEDLAMEVRKGGVQVAYSDYDWSLNHKPGVGKGEAGR